MTQVLGRLIQAGMVELETQAQDGMLVRASAGAASFRRQPTLEKALGQAQSILAALEQAAETAESQPDVRTARQKAAQERATSARVARLEAALDEMPAFKAAKKASEGQKARLSSTDPQARVMKMPDGGYRPAYKWQFGVELSNFAITGVEVVNTGSDEAQMEPMVEQVLERTRKLPDNWLIDAGFVKLTTIAALDEQGICVIGPVPEPKDDSRDRYVPLASDAPAVATWRQRMGTQAAKNTYKQRSLVELPNAQARSRYGVQQVRLRGHTKVRCVALWVAITHNLLIWLRHLRQTGAPQSVSA